MGIGDLNLLQDALSKALLTFIVRPIRYFIRFHSAKVKIIHIGSISLHLRPPNLFRYLFVAIIRGSAVFIICCVYPKNVSCNTTVFHLGPISAPYFGRLSLLRLCHEK